MKIREKVAKARDTGILKYIKPLKVKRHSFEDSIKK